MLIIIIWVFGALLLLINIILRTRLLRLEARVKELINPQEYGIFLRKLPKPHEKLAAIKALRKKYPELSLLDADKIWQQR